MSVNLGYSHFEIISPCYILDDKKDASNQPSKTGSGANCYADMDKN